MSEKKPTTKTEKYVPRKVYDLETLEEDLKKEAKKFKEAHKYVWTSPSGKIDFPGTITVRLKKN